MARPERFELPTARFVAGYSIQLSYGRVFKTVMESGGEGGIRTLEGLLTLTPLAGERFQPLSHLSYWPAGSNLVPALRRPPKNQFTPAAFLHSVAAGGWGSRIIT